MFLAVWMGFGNGPCALLQRAGTFSGMPGTAGGFIRRTGAFQRDLVGVWFRNGCVFAGAGILDGPTHTESRKVYRL